MEVRSGFHRKIFGALPPRPDAGADFLVQQPPWGDSRLHGEVEHSAVSAGLLWQAVGILAKLKAQGFGVRAIARQLAMPPFSVHRALSMAA